MEFANRLKQILKERNISQAELAQAVGVSQRAVSKWINGTEPTASNIYNCCLFLKESADYLLGLETEEGTRVVEELTIKSMNDIKLTRRK